MGSVRKDGLNTHQIRRFKLSGDPRLVETLHDRGWASSMNHPDNAVVFSVDEKNQIQALDRTGSGDAPDEEGKPSRYFGMKAHIGVDAESGRHHHPLRQPSTSRTVTHVRAYPASMRDTSDGGPSGATRSYHGKVKDKYSPEFKREAVGLIRQPGASVSEVKPGDIGVGANLLDRDGDAKFERPRVSARPFRCRAKVRASKSSCMP